MRLRLALILGALLGACVINTRPHLPGSADDAAAAPTNGGRGETDTGATDAGTVQRSDVAPLDRPLSEDLGIPAAFTDAGAMDAGTTDAGTTDADATDAGTTDADATDADATDADATDADLDARTDDASGGGDGAASDAPDATGAGG